MGKIIKSYSEEQFGIKTIGIKSLSPTDANSSIEKDTTNDTQYEGNEIIERATEQAEQIIKNAKQLEDQIQKEIYDKQEKALLEIEESRQRAVEEGFNEGFKQGEKESKDQYNSFIEEAKRIVEVAKQDQLAEIERSKVILVKMAASMAEKVIHTSLSNDDQYWEFIVTNALREVQEHEEIKLYVHPKWYEKTIQQKEELRALLPQSKDLYVYPDYKLNETDCVIETTLGKVDASVDSQLSELKRQLLNKVEEMEHDNREVN